jgi:hypothetical protein
MSPVLDPPEICFVKHKTRERSRAALRHKPALVFHLQTQARPNTRFFMQKLARVLSFATLIEAPQPEIGDFELFESYSYEG